VCIYFQPGQISIRTYKNLQLAETDHEFAVGGTSGIGETSAREFVRNTTQPRVYLVGRSPEQASRIIQELVKLNPEGKVSFVKSDLSLLRNVDVACKEIQAKEDKVNLLFMTPGYITGKGRDGISSPPIPKPFHLSPIPSQTNNPPQKLPKASTANSACTTTHACDSSTTSSRN
jgi:hypothetical protein